MFDGFIVWIMLKLEWIFGVNKLHRELKCTLYVRSYLIYKKKIIIIIILILRVCGQVRCGNVVQVQQLSCKFYK